MGYGRTELKVVAFDNKIVISGKKMHNFHRMVFPLSPVTIPVPSDVDISKVMAELTMGGDKLIVKAPWKVGREIFIAQAVI